MRDFHQSRGRILFEVFCAFVVAASCAGAWMQTGASALLPVALVALLYGVVHAFDLARRNPADAADPERIDLATDQHDSLVAPLDSDVPLAAAEQLATTDEGRGGSGTRQASGRSWKQKSPSQGSPKEWQSPRKRTQGNESYRARPSREGGGRGACGLRRGRSRPASAPRGGGPRSARTAVRA